MPLEERRRHLMSHNTDWPEAVSLPKSGPAAPEEPTIIKPPTGPDATATPNMEYEVTQPTRSKTFVSCKGWTVGGLLERGKSRFKKVPRVSALAPASQLRSAIKQHEESGIPLIIEGWHKHAKWPKDKFTIEWFRKHGQQDAKARNVHDWSDRDISLSDLIEKQRALPTWAEPDESERLYGKDAHCPDAWTKWLHEANVIPSALLPEGPDNLLQCLPPSERVETLMCYLGIGDTFTPCHKDLCASSGQNIMCYTEKSGSSFWFMTAGSDAPAAAKYFHELGKELDLETHVVTVEELEKAPFTTYVTEQKLGDMVLVPPRSCHQVVNKGGITIKTSWSRMTLDGLSTAFYHELPIYRRVCRNETYRVKYTIYHALLQYIRDLEKYAPLPSSSKSANGHNSRLPVSSSRDDPLPPTSSGLSTKRRQENELRRLIDLFDDVLAEEYHKDHKEMSHLTASSMLSDESSTGSAVPSTTQEGSSRITCDFCGTDIFQSFFECRECVASPPSDAMDTGEAPEAPSDDSLVICSSCYVEGRSCRCEIMQPMQCRPFSELIRDRNMAVKVLQRSQVGKESTNTHEVMDESNILSKVKLGIFDAAFAMYKYRRDQSNNVRSDESTRSCFVRPIRHPVYRSSQLQCKKCHSGLCFTHILDLGLHSAEAIMVYQSDPSHSSWHDHHRDRTILGQVLEAEKAEKDGTRCDVRYKLALTAGKFDTCMPSNPRFTKAGWYDKFIQISTIPTEGSEKQVIENLMDDIIAPYTPLSPLSSLPSSPSVASSDLPDSDDEFLPSSGGRTLSLGSEDHLSVRSTALMGDGVLVELAPIQKKRKREILDYILIPPLSEAVRSSSDPTTSQDIPATQANGEEEQREKERETDGRLPVDIETPSEVSESVSHSPIVVSPPSLSKRLKIAARRIVMSSSRETTPFDIPASSSAEDDEPLVKRARFETRPSGSGDTAKSSISIIQKRKVGAITTTTAECSGTPVSTGATVPHARYSNDRDSQRRPPKETTKGRLARNLNRSFGKSSLGRGSTLPTTPILPNRNVSQAGIATRPRCCNGEKQLDKRIELLEKQAEAREREFQAFRHKFQELLQHRVDQDRIDGNHRLKLQQEFSKLRQTTQQESTASQNLILGMRTDIDDLKTQVAGKTQPSMSPTNSTHIVVRDSTGRYLNFEHNNATPQFEYKSKGKQFPRHNQPNRQFPTHPDNLQDQHPPQFPQQPGRDIERSIPPPSHSMPPRQNHGYVNGNKTEKSGEIIRHSTGPQGNFWRGAEGWAPQSSNATPRQDYGSHNGNTFNTGAPNSNRYHRERSNEGWVSRSMSHHQGHQGHQGHGYDIGNKFNKPPHPPFHPNGRGYWQRDPVAGPSKPHHQGPAPLNRKPMKKWSHREAPQEPIVSSPNNIDILPALSSRIDQDQRCSTDGAGVPEHSMSPSLMDEAEEPHRELTPSEHWEDEYDQNEEEPSQVQHTVRNDDFEPIPVRAHTPTEPPIRATTPGDASLAPDGSMESNPWAS